ncbi:MAG: hypothetical protein M3Q64_03330 [bacterium]|nr:hypothetical protein [bacterium]
MNKKTKLKLNETLDKALEPPKKRDLSKLDELLNPYDVSEKPHFEVGLPNIAEYSQPIIVQDNQSNLTNLTNLTKPISPKTDYAKVANSIAREAVPERLFKGMSKNTYDALYLKTRGAINPVRKVRATKSDLLRWTGVSDVTIDKHIKHLKLIGLLKVDFIIGSHDGNWYEVFIPEEINITNVLNQLNQPTQPIIPNKVGGMVSNKVSGDWVGNPIEKKETYASPKTSLKTIENNDDEFALTSLIEKLGTASHKLVNKGLSRSDKDRWGELAELLVMELEIAAARTKSVSNVPAFLTEHLRRRLHSSSTLAKSPESKVSKSLRVGQANDFEDKDVEVYQAEPLSKKGREAVLKTMQEYLDKGQGEFILSFQNTYTSEDWDWLSKELEKEK